MTSTSNNKRSPKETNALKRSMDRIKRLFDVPDQDIDFSDDMFEDINKSREMATLRPFVERKFDWHLEASYKPDAYTLPAAPQREELNDIFPDIINDLNVDQISQYAREERHHSYFEKAWGSADKFRETQRYFKEAYTRIAGDASYIYDKSNVIAELTSKNCGDLETLQKRTASIKKDIAEFEHHLEAYQKSLNYHLEQIDAVKSYIKGSLRTDKGTYLSDISGHEAKNPALEALSTDRQETIVDARVDAYLTERNMNGPLIMDHVRAAANTAIDPLKGFTPQLMYSYFQELEKRLKGNVESCKNIGKYCKDTRAQIDRIVQQECRKEGIEL